MNIEIESKWTLDQEDYKALLNNCKIIKTTDQLNVYYDDDWKLAKLGGSCRIRFLNNSPPIFTLKTPLGQIEENNTRKSIEYEMPAKEVLKSVFFRSFNTSDLKPELKDVLKSLNITIMKRSGWMRNTRYVVELSKDLVFELDRFTLPGNKVCYEAEIENEDQDKINIIVSNILKIATRAQPSKMSKFKRFVAAKINN